MPENCKKKIEGLKRLKFMVFLMIIYSLRFGIYSIIISDK